MNFVHPYMLLGLLFVAVPIVLHLLTRQQVMTYRFAAIEFIRRSNRKTTRRFQLKQLLLLLVRVGCVVAAAMALSKPYLMSGGSDGDSKISHLPVSTVLLIDNSRSMGFVSHRGTTLLDLALHRAMNVVDGMAREDNAAVMAISGGGGSGRASGTSIVGGAGASASTSAGSSASVSDVNLSIPVLTFDRKVVKEVLSSVRQSNRGANVLQSVNSAVEVLKDSPLPVKRVILFTDCTRNSWKSSGFEIMVPDGVELVLVDVAEGMELWNRAIMGVRVSSAHEQGPGVFRIDADIANFSTRVEEELTVSIEVDGRVVNKGFVRLEPGRMVTKTFYHALSSRDGIDSDANGRRGGVRSSGAGTGGGTGVGGSGNSGEGSGLATNEKGASNAMGIWHKGRVLLPADPLPSDNQWPFVLEEKLKLRVLAVNGEPSTIARNDELFFLREVIAPVRSRLQHGGVSMVLREVIPERMSEMVLSDFHVVVMANVERLRTGDIAELESYVTRGGGLLIAGGDNVDPAWYNNNLANLLPQPIRDVQVWSESGADFAGGALQAGRGESYGTGLRLSLPDTADSMWSFLSGEGAEGFFKSRFSKLLLLEPSGSGERSTLLQFDNGLPVLVEKSMGRGKVMLLASTLDRAWTDMPIRPYYLPMLDRICQRLGRVGVNQGVQTMKLGETEVLSGLPARSGAKVRLQYPDGTMVVVPVQGEVFGERSVLVESGDEPGVLMVVAVGEGGAGVGGGGEAGVGVGVKSGSILAAVSLVPESMEADLTRLPDGVISSLTRGVKATGDLATSVTLPGSDDADGVHAGVDGGRDGVSGKPGYGSPKAGVEAARLGGMGVTSMANLWPYALLLLLFLLVGETVLLSVGGGIRAFFQRR